MARKEREESSGPDQGWIVTFSDCMTLLLCFFVLLLTFSSFEEVKFKEMTGAFESLSNDAVTDIKEKPDESIVEQVESPRSTSQGSTADTNTPPHDKPNKKDIELSFDKHKDRVTFYMPSSSFFYREGVSLKQQGKHKLMQFAQYLKKANCCVVIGESSIGSIGINRACTIKNFIKRFAGLASSQFRINGDLSPDPYRFHGSNIVCITFLNSEADK